MKIPNSFLDKLFTGAYNLSKDSTIHVSYDGLLSPVNFDFNAVDGYKYRQEFRIRFFSRFHKTDLYCSATWLCV